MSDKSDIKIDLELANETVLKKIESIKIIKSRNTIESDKVKQSILDLEQVINLISKLKYRILKVGMNKKKKN